ncbi:MAG: hypothetical protein EA356_16435 [Geminicoccaceae bacterium]|nr:MAG: hypothetical protein EA356_16435 [Geminicoccaceae bacterium]
MPCRRRLDPLAWALGLGLALALLAGPALGMVEDCRRLTLTDGATGAAIVGVEDIRISADGSRAYLSAHDRRAEPPTEGAIHPLELGLLAAGPSQLSLPSWRPEPPTPGGFRPHGIALTDDGELLVINRRVGPDGRIQPTIDRLEIHDDGLNEIWSRQIPGLCNPNALFALAGDAFLVSNDRGACSPWRLRLETWLGLSTGSIERVIGGTAEPALSRLNHPNGVVLLDDALWFAETRKRRVTVFAPFGPELARSYNVGFAPDNLTIDDQGRLWVAGPRRLLGYAAFIHEWPLFGRAGSRVAFIADGEVTRVLDDDGSLISGATVAAVGGGLLLIGAAYDDAIAYCRLVD